MALTYTPEIENNFKCPDFQLPSVDGKTYGLTDFSNSNVLVVMFICNHCPYVQAIEDRYVKLAHSYNEKDVQFVGICSNDSTEYPEDSPGELLKRWQEKSYKFPYLHDETQQVAKTFGAVCTPDIFVFNQDRQLCYRGRLDDSWKSPENVQKQELRAAIDEILLSGQFQGAQHPSMGCSIKWNE